MSATKHSCYSPRISQHSSILYRQVVHSATNCQNSTAPPPSSSSSSGLGPHPYQPLGSLVLFPPPPLPPPPFHFLPGSMHPHPLLRLLGGRWGGSMEKAYGGDGGGGGEPHTMGALQASRQWGAERKRREGGSMGGRGSPWQSSTLLCRPVASMQQWP